MCRVIMTWTIASLPYLRIPVFANSCTPSSSFVTNPKSLLALLLRSFTDLHRAAVRTWSHPLCVFPTEAERGALPSGFSCPSCGLCRIPFSTFLYLVWVISRFQMAPRCRAGVFPRRKNSGRCLTEKIRVSRKLRSSMSYSAVDREVSVNQQ